MGFFLGTGATWVPSAIAFAFASAFSRMIFYCAYSYSAIDNCPPGAAGLATGLGAAARGAGAGPRARVALGLLLGPPLGGGGGGPRGLVAPWAGGGLGGAGVVDGLGAGGRVGAAAATG